MSDTDRSIHATTQENMEAAIAHWSVAEEGGERMPPKPISRRHLHDETASAADTSTIGDITPPGGITPGNVTPPRHYDSASRLAALEFEAHASEGNPSLQVVSTGAKWESLVGYSRAVKRGPFIYLSGTASVDQATGQVLYPGDPYRQARQALAIAESALGALGSSLKDVVRTRMFVVDLARDSAAVSKAHGEVFGGLRPASTMVEVGRLYSKVLVMIELDAIADVEF